MKLFKQNPVFAALLTLFILLFIGGLAGIYFFQQQAAEEKGKIARADSQLRAALMLEPAPTMDNIEAAEANVQSLETELKKRIDSTKGKKPTIMQGKPPASGTQMLFKLTAYSQEFAQVAERTIPINVSDSEIETMREAGERLPSTTIPANFAFGFSRYIETGEPPADKDVAVIFQQNQILNYVLRKLFSTRPISIVSIQREALEIPLPPPGANRGSNQQGPKPRADEFRIGSETARVEGAVETLAFKIVFTGYTENLRSFLKQIEEFEIPLIVSSVEVKPLTSGVSVAAAAQTNGTPFGEIFGNLGGEAEADAIPEEGIREPIVSENISEFTVVLEYITVNITKQKAATDDAQEEDLI